MLSILVCHSYFLRLDQKQLERGKPYPPLATLQVAAMLRKAGHHVSLFDAMLAEGLDDYNRVLRATEPQLVLFYEDTFNFLSKMCLGTMRRAACDMIASARRLGARVIVAGPDVSDAPGPYLQAGADLTRHGSLQNAIPHLLAAQKAGADPYAAFVPAFIGVGTLGVIALQAAASLAVISSAVRLASSSSALRCDSATRPISSPAKTIGSSGCPSPSRRAFSAFMPTRLAMPETFCTTIIPTIVIVRSPFHLPCYSYDSLCVV